MSDENSSFLWHNFQKYLHNFRIDESIEPFNFDDFHFCQTLLRWLSTNDTDCHNIAEMLLKVALNTTSLSQTC